ncbi:Ankyrin-1 [Eumeta japonica]|uniref:Ankyrin-1 n=1 Tax=Eumeta variegata TaxID=151549 RepID=A0A4C1S7R0_EUMVA|nr:Ankyrin-1 [Eumeta japonica]
MTDAPRRRNSPSSKSEEPKEPSFLELNKERRNREWRRLIRDVVLQRGQIPLLLAVEAGNQSMVRELLSAQTAEQLKAGTPAGDTALHLAARRRDVDMARILVDYGAPVDATNGAGQTALHIAAAEGDEPLVKYFYGVRANAAIADNEATSRVVYHIRVSLLIYLGQASAYGPLGVFEYNHTTVIHGTVEEQRTENRTLVYSDLNVKHVTLVTPAGFKTCVVMALNMALMILTYYSGTSCRLRASQIRLRGI